MRDRDGEFRADERAGQSRVHVADDDDPVGPLLHDDRLEVLHHGGGLLRVARASDAEVYIRLRQSEVAEERVRHLRVVVLPRVHDERRELARAPPHRLHHGRDLHEVRTRADDVDDFEH